MAYETPNRRRDRETWSDYVTKKSDDDQILGNQVAVHAEVIVDHDPDDGKHAIKDPSEWIAGLVISESAGIALTNSVDDVSTFELIAPPDSMVAAQDPQERGLAYFSSGLAFPYDPWRTFYGYPANLENGFWSGISICKGADSGGGEAECVLVFQATHIVSSQYYNFEPGHMLVRRVAGSGTSDFDMCTVGGKTPGYQMRQTFSVENYRKQVPNKQLRDATLVEGAPLARNFYDEQYQNCEAIHEAIGVRHTAGVSYPICWDEFYGAKFYECSPVDYDETDEFTIAIVGQHDGVHCAVLPTAWGIGFAVTPAHPEYTPTHTEQIGIAPAFDDRNVALIAWQVPGFTSTGRAWLAATKIPLTLPPDPDMPGAFTSSITITRGDPVYTDPGGTPSALDLIERNDERLVKLWGAEHQTGGLHALGLDRITDAELVLDEEPFTADATVGEVVDVPIEAWPSPNPIYLVGVVMDPGTNEGPGSMVMVTLGGDEVTAKIYMRTIVNNGVLTGTVTVWRLPRT